MEPFTIHPSRCSCTCCVYRSRSKEPNVQRLLQEGSDIDKLYYGKFLPLRERKLLEKLIRTRDVYDDVRNQLVSASDQAIPKHKKKRRDEDLSPEQSSAVLEMVGLVDRGQMGSANSIGPFANKAKLSSCCSCCSCETLRKIRKRMEKEDKKHPKVHRQIVTCEDIAKYCEEAAIKGRKRRRKLSTKLSSKLGSARLKIKKNLSEPTVVSKSRAFVKRIRSKRKTTYSIEEGESRVQQTKTAKHKRKREKNFQSHSSKDSATEMRSPLADKIKKYSLILFNEKMPRKQPYDKNKYVECRPGTCIAGTCAPEECFDKIKSKRVGKLFREKMPRIRPYDRNKYVECRPGTCKAGTCAPEECFDKIKSKRVAETRKIKPHDIGRRKSHISMKIRPKKVKERESQVKVAKVKSSSSMTTILKTRTMESLSKTELKGKIPASTKPVKGMLGKTLAKSAASMTSIPEIKEKRTEEKAARKLKSKVKSRHAQKGKELTISTSSFTSVPREKATKSHSKTIKILEHHEGEPAPPPISHKIGRQKPTREPDEDIKEADIQKPMEHVKAKKEKRMKPTHGRKQHQIYKHSTTQLSGASAKASKHSNIGDSGSQSSKPRGRKVLSKSKSQGTPAMASVERLKRKSVGSAFSQKTSSRSGTKSKHKQSKSAENVARKRRYASKEPPPEIDENAMECYPNRQAVKISSSFSFNIEFYKDTYPCVEVAEQPDFVSSHTPRLQKRMKHHHTQHRRKFRDHGSGHVRSLQNSSSQSDSTQSFKSTQVAHKLKRCFCTQKLIQTKKQKLNYDESKKTMASLDSKDREVVAREIRTKRSGNGYSISPTISTQASLPYECNRDICARGECDPYECYERINRRDRGAGTIEAPKKSKVASTSPSESKSTLSKVQSGENRKIKRRRKHTQNIAYSPRPIEPKFSSDRTGQRQAVRISSNFNFSVEFSKTCLNDRVAANAMIYDRPIHMERRHMHPKGIKVYKPRVRHETSETTRKFRHQTSETTRTAKKTKQSHTEPFLQRCLCTLKLLKKNKKEAEKSPWRNRDEYIMHMQNRAQNRYNPERSKLLPYECEPGLCIPKKYHPYDCEKLIKVGHTKSKHKYSQINDLRTLSIFSKTSEMTTSSESQYTPFCTRESRQVNKINQRYNEIMCDRNKKRVLRGGSNMSSTAQFSREKSSHYKRTGHFITAEDVINKHTKKKSKTTGSQQLEHPAHHTPIDTKAKPVEKGSSVVSLIKRCFSILKFTRKANKLGLENKNNVITEKTKASRPFSKQNSEYKCTPGRLSEIPYGLRSPEREANYCSPRMGRPYERYEENKRRQVDGIETPHVNTKRRERKQVKSVTSEFCGNTNVKTLQPRLFKHETKEHHKVRNEQKEKTARPISSSRLTVYEESEIKNNYNFKKKKSTNRLMSSVWDTTNNKKVEKFNTISDISGINGMKDKYCFSQENKLKREHQASNLGFLLKKCFCRLGFQKKKIPEGEFHWQQPITAQYVQVENNNVKMNRHNVTKTLYIKEPLQSKLSEGGYVFKENLIKSQNGMNNPRYNSSQHFPKSSFSRRGHIRSQIDVDFNKMKNFLHIQKINPFYRSFYALNVSVSKLERKDVLYKLKNKSRKSEPDCETEECDPQDCSKRIRRLKRYKKKEERRRREEELKNKVPCKDMSVTSHKDCYERCQAEFEKRKKPKKKKGPHRPLVLGSDFKIRAGVYKDTDPYKNSRRQAIRIGSDAKVDLDFFREPTRRNLCHTGPIPASRLPKNRAMMEESISNLVSRKVSKVKSKPLDTQLYDKHQRRPSGIKLMMKRLSRRPLRLKRDTRSDLDQRIEKNKYSFCRDPTTYKSTPRLSKRREASTTKYFKCKECAPRQQKKPSKSIDRNNVTFCTDVNCLEFNKDETSKKRASIKDETPKKKASIVSRFTCIKDDQGQRKGEGDVEKQNGPVQGNKTIINKCLCTVKNKKIKCKCGAKNAKNCLCEPVKDLPIDSAKPLATLTTTCCQRCKKLEMGSIKPLKGGEELESPKKKDTVSVKPVKGDGEPCVCPRSKKKDTGSVKPVKGEEGLATPQKCFCTRSKKKDTRSAKPLKGGEELESPKKKDTVSVKPVKGDEEPCVCPRSKKKDTGSVKPVKGEEGLATPQKCFCTRSKKKDTRSVKPLKGGEELESSQKCVCLKTNLGYPLKGVQELATPQKALEEPKKLTMLQKLLNTGSKKSNKELTDCFCDPLKDQTQVQTGNDGKKKYTGFLKPNKEYEDLAMPQKYDQGKNLQTSSEKHLKICKVCGMKEEVQKKRKKKKCKQLQEAEREMETIMPFSKKKFKKRESRSKLAPDDPGAPKHRHEKHVCASKCKSIAKVIKHGIRESGKEAGIDTGMEAGIEAGKLGDKKHSKIPDYDVRMTPSFECLCNKEARLRRLCPVCRAKAKGKFIKTKNKLPCTCMEEEIKPEKPKDLSKCPMCKESLKKKDLKKKKCPCCKKPFSLSEDQKSVKGKVLVEEIPVVDNTPLFEMMLNTTNMKIVNKEEVIKKIGQTSKQAAAKEKAALKQKVGHGKRCKCCICRGLQKGADLLGGQKLKPEALAKPCICGSLVCKKDWNKIKQEQKALASVAAKLKKCVCGSNICAEESSKMPEVFLEQARQEEHDKVLARRAIAKEKAYQKARAQRRKEREAAKKKQEKLRKKRDKVEMKQIKKNDTAGDVTMLAESLIDLGTFGSKAFCDITKTLFRAVLHPRDAITDLRDAASAPGGTAKSLKRSLTEAGLFSTGKRVQARMSKMPTAKRALKQLESYQTTNYIVHMADKDPKKRILKSKAKRTREPLDFQCSLYMASMRRRPCLRVYYMCPWFYPHCVALLGLWKQLLDVVLFILAVLVWSPCIMCMELCRGFVCCVLCQG